MPTFKYNFTLIKNWVWDKLRGAEWLWLALVGIILIFFFAPYQLGVLAWGVTKLSVGAFMGYWIDRTLLKPRPHEVTAEMQKWAWIRRAMIISAAMISLGLTV